MTHFIRDHRNKSIVDIDVFTDENGEVDLSCTVLIEPYSKFLTENLENDLQIINDFQSVQDIRGWLWEVYKPANDNVTKEDVSARVKRILTQLSDAYVGLRYVED